MNLLRHSLVARITAYLLAITGMTVLSIGFTMMIAQNSQGDAAAINIAGSLRLNSAQLSEALGPLTQTQNGSQQNVSRLTDQLTAKLEGPALAVGYHYTHDEILQEQLAGLKALWHNTLIPLLDDAIHGSSNDVAQARVALNNLIHHIDQYVSTLESSTKSKMHLLGSLQLLFFLLIGVLLFIALYDIRHNLVTPLRQLRVLSREAGHGNFQYRSNFSSHDELGQLGRAFDQMAARLDTRYQALEARVSRKQAELKRHNRALQIIHNGSRTLYGGGNDLCASTAPILRELEDLLDIGPIVLSLRSEHDDTDMAILATHSSERPLYCRDLNCLACLEPQRGNAVARNAEAIVLPVAVGEEILGSLTVGYSAPINASKQQLLNTLTDNLATAIFLQKRIEEEQQLSLVNERTIIARELHDSLAQSLSYLKMQVTRLERIQEKQFSAEQQRGVTSDLREGLNSAYRQLRELLSTFRLSLDKPGLQPALQQTIKEFSQRLGFPVELTYRLPPHLLSASEEIHLLQITREALANTHKHAKAHWAHVSLVFDQATLHLAIEDDGIGLQDDQSPPMHYGLVIMRDRANNINADLHFNNRPEGGTGVYLCFTPLTERLIKEGST